MEKLIERKEYLDFLIRNSNKPIIKVVSGVRRCGKSTLFDLYRLHLIANGISAEQIISINFEELEFEELTDYKKLYAYIVERLIPNQMNYVFLDEIQHVTAFEKAVDSLYVKKNVDLYLTGSNAYFMSSELATLLAGRYIELQMLPLSFKEYCSANTDASSLSEKYQRYLIQSSFPYACIYLQNQTDINTYLQGLYNTILIKDIATRYKIGDINMLESVIKFIFSNIGNRLSPKSIADTMTSQGRKIDNKTVENYLRSLTESLMIYQSKRYNIKGKQFLKLQEKYYIVDIGLRFMLIGGKNLDVGHILENIVYLELLRRGYDIYVGQLDDKEVDFVAMSQNNIVYFQIAASVRDETTLKRELAPLLAIKDSYPKYILTLDEDPDADYNGIKRINVLQWLLT